jgi:peptide/nickel transport system substrate-binding protein
MLAYGDRPQPVCSVVTVREEMEDHTVNTTTSRWRVLALLAVMAMIVAACSDAGTDAPTTTATTAPSGDTDTTEPSDDTPSPGAFEYTMAIFSDPTTDNPWAAIDTESDVWTSYVNPTMFALYEYQGPTYTLVPAMASEGSPPEVVADGDNWSVTVPLRDDVTWSDGTPATANDVVFTWNTVVKYGGLGGNFPAQWPMGSDDSQGILSVEALDDLTVKITFNFEAGLAIWPFAVGVANVYPEHFWGPIVDANDSFEGMYSESGLGAPSATGFESSEWEPGAFWRNVAVEDYYDKGARFVVYDNGAVEYTSPDGVTEAWGGDPAGEVVADYVEGPYATDVTFSLYSDQNAAVLALTDGAVDFLLNPLGLQRGLQQLVLSEPSLNVIINEQNGYRYLAFNTRKAPMNDVAFRQAISCRIDKAFMANTVLGGSAIPSTSQVPPGNSFWANPDLAATCDGLSEQERFETAKQLLVDAGYTWTTEPMWDEANLDVIPEGAGLASPDGTPVPAMELLAPGPGYDPLRATYSLFIEQWSRQMGIPVTANPTGFTVIVDKVFAAGDAALDWDMYILGWGLTPFPDHIFTFFTTANDSATGGFNVPGYSNPEFDALADEFARAKTLEEARDLIFQADAILAEDLPYVVLFTTPIIEAYRNTIEFPFTSVLDGIQNFGGLAGSTTAA